MSNLNKIQLKKYLVVEEIETEDDDSPITDVKVNTLEGFITERYDESSSIYRSLNKKYVAKKGDVLFFDSNCTVPRFKLKLFCDKYDVKVSKTVDKANIIFIGSDTINNNFSRENYSIVEMSFFKDFINIIFPMDHPIRNQIEELSKDCNNTSVLFANYHAWYNINTHTLIEDLIKRYYGEDNEKDSKWVLTLNKDHNLKFDILNDSRIFAEDEILKYVNIDNVMDEESFNNVKSLFESEDSSNHMLALEIMANCDYRKSAVYLLLLFEKYSHQIYNSPSRKHVNFKSFLKFFDLNASRNYSISDIMNTLKRTKLATPDNLEIVIKYTKEDLLSSQAEDHLVIKVLVPNDETKKFIKESVIDTAIEDNVPYLEQEIQSKIETLEFKI